MSEFPQQPKDVKLTPATFNLPELAAQHALSSGAHLPVQQTSSKPGIKRQQTYVRTADAQREKERDKEKKKGESRKSKVGEKIKKRLSMR